MFTGVTSEVGHLKKEATAQKQRIIAKLWSATSTGAVGSTHDTVTGNLLGAWAERRVSDKLYGFKVCLRAAR